MKKRKKILLVLAASLAGLLLAIGIAAIVVVQTPWFANFVRQKVISALDDSTGGVTEIGSLEVDLRHLTVRIRNAVLHGKEPGGADPLLRVKLLELRLAIFSKLSKPVGIEYLGIDQPLVNIMLLPDGTTNIPQPKTPSPPSQTSGLQTVVDLAVNKFRLDHGLIEFLQQKTAFSGRGENLRALLNYNTTKPGYLGNLSIDPLIIASGSRPPLNVHVNVPITLESDAIRVPAATLHTDQSQINVSASVENMNAPVIAARLNARLSLPELQKSIDLPIDANARGAPKDLSADLSVSINQTSNAIQIQTARLSLGRTTFQAAGNLNPTTQGAAQFNANFALAELARLLKLSSIQPTGDLQANGRASVDPHNNYAIDGTLNSRQLSVRSGTTRVSGVTLYSPFHVDPYLISLDGLKLNALSGSLAAKIFLEKFRDLSVEGHLRNFSLPVLAAAFTGKQLGYDGALDGVITAKGNLQAKGVTGYTAQTRLEIVPGRHGVPMRGYLDANYSGARDALDIGHASYIALPNSRLDLSGSLNRRIDLKLVSRNLNDFLPAINFGAAHPQSAMPVVLQGGTALVQAQVSGKTSNPDIGGHLEVTDFAVEQRSFTRLALDLAASSSNAAIQHGVLLGKGLNTAFDASLGLSRWTPKPASPLRANLTLRNGDLADLVNLAGESSTQASGAATADIHINGRYGDPLGAARVQVTKGSIYQQPFTSFVANVNLADQLVTLSQLELDTAGGKISSTGTFRHPRDGFTTGHAQLKLAIDTLQLAAVQALTKQNAGIGGVIQLAADAAADVRNQNGQTSLAVLNVTADLSARDLHVQNQNAGSLTASARTANGSVNYNLNSDFAGSQVKLKGATALSGGYFTNADATIKNLSVAKLLQLTGQGTIPASGELSADAHVDGTTTAPNARLKFALLRADLYQEPINSLEGQIQYSNRLIEIPSIDLNVPAGSVSLSGSFNHPANNFNTGALELRLHSSDIQVDRIQHVQTQKPGLGGTLRLAADLSANLRDEHGKVQPLISHLNADASVAALHLNNTSLGGMNFRAKTAGSTLDFRLDSDIAKTQIHGTGQAQLSGDYPTRGNLSFKNIKYSNLLPLLSNQPSSPSLLEALVEGSASVNGPLLNPDGLAARLQLDRLYVHTNQNASPTGAPSPRTVELQNQGPILVALNHEVVQIEQLNISGRDTSIKASGSINLKNENEPLALNLEANLNLGLLQDADQDFYSSGSVAMNAVVRGSFAQPRANGRIELKNANVNYSGAPNGLSNANGVILLNGTNASIQNLVGESGGGRIALSGFVGLGTRIPSFNLQAEASKVRVRYTGVSVTSNAKITLTGNLRRSLLAGTVSVERIAYASSSDAGSILSTVSTPPTTPSSPSPLLSSMRLNIHILTAPDVQVVSTYSNRLSVLANLTVRGTAETPGMLGRITINDGQLVFFGNTYTVSVGTINFYDPNSISPTLNISLDTNAQGVNVTIGVTGPMDDLKLSYRSDPPLTFEQIVQLLATNTTPANPVIAAHQPTPPQQSLSQMGESALLGQAVANPLASRVQRVFGLSQLRIDPTLAGGSGGPSARVTLQEKVLTNVTFTYINDINQSNSQIVRVQWDLTNNLSAVGLRDYNGNVSIEFFYKFAKR